MPGIADSVLIIADMNSYSEATFTASMSNPCTISKITMNANGKRSITGLRNALCKTSSAQDLSIMGNASGRVVDYALTPISRTFRDNETDIDSMLEIVILPEGLTENGSATWGANDIQARYPAFAPGFPVSAIISDEGNSDKNVGTLDTNQYQTRYEQIMRARRKLIANRFTSPLDRGMGVSLSTSGGASAEDRPALIPLVYGVPGSNQGAYARWIAQNIDPRAGGTKDASWTTLLNEINAIGPEFKVKTSLMRPRLSFMNQRLLANGGFGGYMAGMLSAWKTFLQIQIVGGIETIRQGGIATRALDPIRLFKYVSLPKAFAPFGSTDIPAVHTNTTVNCYRENGAVMVSTKISFGIYQG